LLVFVHLEDALGDDPPRRAVCELDEDVVLDFLRAVFIDPEENADLGVNKLGRRVYVNLAVESCESGDSIEECINEFSSCHCNLLGGTKVVARRSTQRCRTRPW